MNEETIARIKKEVRKRGLYIPVIPERAKEEFLRLAEEEFAGDWGNTLKWLLDFRNGLLSSPNQILMEQMEALYAQVNKPEPKEPEPKKKVIKSVSGKIITEVKQ